MYFHFVKHTRGFGSDPTNFQGLGSPGTYKYIYKYIYIYLFICIYIYIYFFFRDGLNKKNTKQMKHHRDFSIRAGHERRTSLVQLRVARSEESISTLGACGASAVGMRCVGNHGFFRDLAWKSTWKVCWFMLVYDALCCIYPMKPATFTHIYIYI